MCPPLIAVAGLALSAASAVVGYQAQVAQVEAQNQAIADQNRFRRESREEAKRAAQEDFNHLNVRQVQEEAKAFNEIDEVNLEAMRARATAEVAAGESGVSGISVDRMMRDITNKANKFGNDTMTNLDFTRREIKQQKKKVRGDAQSRINSVGPDERKVRKPSFLPTAISIGRAAVDAGPQIFGKKRR